jgi:hypothetical protein
MSTFPGTPRILKGGIVLVNPLTGTIQKIILLQYNPDTLTRSFQIRSVGGEGSNSADAMRLTGPPIESYKLDAEIDATDQLEVAESVAVKTGIQPMLAALETIVYPSSTLMIANAIIANIGTIEILSMESALTLFVWNKHRIVPVRLTELSVTEEAFDVNLNPIRAKVSLGMKVLSVDDLGFLHRGSSIYMNYQQSKENLARMFGSGSLGDLGINSI